MSPKAAWTDSNNGKRSKAKVGMFELETAERAERYANGQDIQYVWAINGEWLGFDPSRPLTTMDAAKMAAERRLRRWCKAALKMLGGDT